MDLWENAAKLGWAACAIDGEGCIDCNFGWRSTQSKDGKKAYCSIGVSVTNTDARFPREMQRIFGTGSIHHRIDPRENSRPTFTWAVGSRKAELVLRAVLPHLVIKREQAEIALAIADTMHRKGRPTTWVGSNRGSGRKYVKAEILAERQRLSEQLKYLKRNPPLEVVS